MKLLASAQGMMMIIDGASLCFNFFSLLEANTLFVQWDESSGKTTYWDGTYTTFTDISVIQPLIDAYNAEISHIAANNLLTEEDKLANVITDSLDFYSSADQVALRLLEASKTSAISTNLPSWTVVETAVDNISSLADAKAFLKKLSRVVYWLAKNTET